MGKVDHLILKCIALGGVILSLAGCVYEPYPGGPEPVAVAPVPYACCAYYNEYPGYYYGGGPYVGFNYRGGGYGGYHRWR